MRTVGFKVKLFHCLLAFTLVFGLMVPSLSTVAYGDPQGAAPAQTEDGALEDALGSASKGAQKDAKQEPAQDDAGAQKGAEGGSGTQDDAAQDALDGASKGGVQQDADGYAQDPAQDKAIPGHDDWNHGGVGDAGDGTDPKPGEGEGAEGDAEDPKELGTTSKPLDMLDTGSGVDCGGLLVAGPSDGFALESVTYTRGTRGRTENSVSDNGRNIPVGAAVSDTLSMLVIKKSGSYTIKNTNGVGTAVATGIRVAPGVNAHLTFAGVNISASFPMDIATNSTKQGNLTAEVTGADVANPTRVHITLADGTTNTLYSTWYPSGYSDSSNQTHNRQFPGLRCGEGSYLTIDDGTLNEDSSGNMIVPIQGVIPDGTSYVDRTGTVRTADSTVEDEQKRFNSLSNLESNDPGTLNVYSGVRSAAIGGGPLENGGIITINGGNINTYAAGDANGSGCGIGGGHAGGGTEITINGGVITAKGSFHGAGIGGGCTYIGSMSNYNTYPFADAIVSQYANHTIAGNITVNGGFVEISGGSVNCTRFQGNDNDGKAYGGKTDENGDTLHTGANKVALVNVNVASKIESMVKRVMKDKLGAAYDEATIASNPEYTELLQASLNAKIESWEFMLNDMPMDPSYGAPARLMNGVLYLWLPEGTYGRDKIDANFSYYVGDVFLTSNTNVPSNVDTSQNPNPISKEWEIFELDPDFVKQNWSKFYDGEPLASLDVSKGGGIPVENPADGLLKDNALIDYGYLKVDENGKATGQSVSSKTMPATSGTFRMEVQSNQYADKNKYPEFAKTYWGHKATGTATVSPISSRTSAEVPEHMGREVETEAGREVYTTPVWLQDAAEEGVDYNTATQNHMFVPIDVTSYKVPFGQAYKDGAVDAKTTCALPWGRVQIYVDGVAVPASLGGVIDYAQASNDDGTPKFDDAGLPVADHDDVAAYRDAQGRLHAVAYFDMNEKRINQFWRTADYRANNNFDAKVAAGEEDPQHEVFAVYTSATRTNLIERASQGGSEGGEQVAALDASVSVGQTQSSAGVDGVEPRWTDSAYENYYESQTATTFVKIATVDPTGVLYNGKGQPSENPDGTHSYDESPYDPAQEGSAPPVDDKYKAGWLERADGSDEAREVSTDYKFYYITDFRDVVGEDGSVVEGRKDWFPAYFTTNSLGDVTFESSDPSVLSFEPAKVSDREYDEDAIDYGIGTRVHVRSAGKATVTARVAANGAYNALSRSFTVYVFPDLSKEPELSLRQTAYDASRKDGTVRPGDEMVYVSTLTNTTPDTAAFTPAVKAKVPASVSLESVSLISPDGTERVLDPSEYEVRVVDPMTGESEVSFTSPDVLYGLQSFSLVLDTRVKPDAAWKALAEPDAVDFSTEGAADAVYGIGDSEFDWDKRYDYVNGTPAKQAVAQADPTLPAERPAPDPMGPGEASEILGGGLSDPEPGPGGTDPAPGVVVAPEPVPGPGTPFGDAKQDPEFLDDPDADPQPEPVKPGDRIVKFGGKDDPETPEDVAKELERIIEQAKKDNEGKPDDEKKTTVDIPVTIESPDPGDPDGEPVIKHVIVTVPVPVDPSDPGEDPGDEPGGPEGGRDPDRDDHGLKVLPTDPVLPGDQPGGDPEDPDDPSGPGEDQPGGDPGDQPGGVASDIAVSKTVENVTDGFGKRKNTYALVGDVLEYSITVENTKEGSAWLAAKVYDPLPSGVEYVPGSAVLTDQFGAKHAIAPEQESFDGASGKLGFKVGDVYGGKKATVTFRVKVTPDAVADGAPVPENLAFAHGTKPTETIVYPEGTGPDDYDPAQDEPVEIALPDPAPGTFDPEDEGEKDVWEEKADPDAPGPKTPEPARPDGTSHTDPDHAKFSTEKMATVIAAADDPEGEELEDREEGVLYVGDTVRYEITFTNHDEPWTAWYDVTVYDKLPEGMVPVPGTFRLTAPGQTESVAIDDSVYDAEDHDVAVWIGRVLGGEAAVLSFDCTVTEAALGSDVGNTAAVAGTDPSATDPSVLDGDPEAVPGVGKRTPKPAKGWESFFEERGASFSQTAYPDGDADIRVVDPNAQGGQPAPGNPEGPGNGVNGGNGGLAAGDGQSGLGSAQDGQGLAKTGDAAPVAALVVLALAAAGALGAGLLRRRRS